MVSFAAHTTGPAELALSMSLPVALAPLTSPFVPLSEYGRRIVLAADGVYLEGNSPALYARGRIATGALPYGRVPSEGALVPHAGPIPRQFIERAMERACEAHPNEMAMAVLRDGAGHRIVEPKQSGSVAVVTYDDTAIDETLLVLDMHSHGPFPAIFSAQDDASDSSRIGPHIAMVFGKCASALSMTMEARVCIGGHFIRLSQADIRTVIA